MWRAAKNRAKKYGIPFTITRENIYIPSHCPVFGIKLVINKDKKQDNSPTLDRINPDLGYIPGNCAVICWKANRFKKDATLSEFESLLSFLKSFNRVVENTGTVIKVNIGY